MLYQQLSGAEEGARLAGQYTEVLVIVNSSKCEPLDYRELGDFPGRLIYLNFEEGELVIQNAGAKMRKVYDPVQAILESGSDQITLQLEE